MTRIAVAFALLVAALTLPSTARADKAEPGYVINVTQHGPSTQYGPTGFTTIKFASASDGELVLFICGTGATGCGNAPLFNDAQQARLAQTLTEVMNGKVMIMPYWLPNGVISAVSVAAPGSSDWGPLP
jgi:hypothetical protein